MKNRAFALSAAGDPTISEVELDLPEPTGSQVVVRVTHAGVCHMDIHVRQGGYDLGSAGWLSMADRGVSYPLVMGHEIAGEVVSVGPDAHERAVGDEVAVYPWLGCGECAVCQEGFGNLCVASSQVLGVNKPGGYGELVLVPEERFAVPLDGVDPAWGATLGCSGLTAISAAEQVSALRAVREDSPVAVIGAGGVGLMCVAALAARGMTDITVLDRSDANFDRARELGAARCVLIGEGTGPREVITAMGPGRWPWSTSSTPARR